MQMLPFFHLLLELVFDLLVIRQTKLSVWICFRFQQIQKLLVFKHTVKWQKSQAKFICTEYFSKKALHDLPKDKTISKQKRKPYSLQYYTKGNSVFQQFCIFLEVDSRLEEHKSKYHPSPRVSLDFSNGRLVKLSAVVHLTVDERFHITGSLLKIKWNSNNSDAPYLFYPILASYIK